MPRSHLTLGVGCLDRDRRAVEGEDAAGDEVPGHRRVCDCEHHTVETTLCGDAVQAVVAGGDRSGHW
ncbi:MAG: hypothetical protein J07HX64_00742 [halophilic archaeon J07HX64]|nr:MAG: hypothetical protein J07HX64_00742 [halophilic archaeon J07HX64]